MIKENEVEEKASTGNLWETDIDAFLMEFEETSGEGELTPEQVARLAQKEQSKSVGEKKEQVKIVDSSLIRKKSEDKEFVVAVSVKLKNVSDFTINTAVVEAVLYDMNGVVIGNIDMR